MSYERLHQVWNWLPAFRAAAESEHLPTAAAALGVTPSAVSRALRQLEQAVGHRLFARVGRRIRLNRAGQDLLDALRDGMRTVRGALGTLEQPSFTREVRIAGSGLATFACALPAVFALREAYPDLVAHIHLLGIPDVRSGLLRGEIEIAVLSQVIAHPKLTSTRIGEASNGLYCSADHELADAEDIDLAELGEYAFTAPSPDARGHTNEGWPAEAPRRVVLHAAHMHVGAEACKRGGLVAVLPDEVGQMHGLVRLPVESIPPLPIVAVHLRAFAEEPECALLMDALRDALARE